MDFRRLLVKRRLHAAEMLARPLALRLEADGVSSVKTLAGVPVRAWEIPECLVEQVERMLGLLVARTCYTTYFQHDQKGSYAFLDDESGSQSTKARGCNGAGVLKSGAAKQTGKKRVCVPWCKSKAFDPRFQRSALDSFGRPPRLEGIQPFIGLRNAGRERANPRPPLRQADDETDEDLPLRVWEKREMLDLPRPNKEEKDPPVATELDLNYPCMNKSIEPESSNHPGCLSPVSRVACPRQDKESANIKRQIDGTKKHEHLVNISLELDKAALEHGGMEQRVDESGRDLRAVFNSNYTKPGCGTRSARYIALRDHERCLGNALEYSRLRWTPQLFRDASTGPWEGMEERATKLRLVLGLPSIIQQELRDLYSKSTSRHSYCRSALQGLSASSVETVEVAEPRLSNAASASEVDDTCSS